MGVYKRVHGEMERLPDNTKLSKECCSNYSGILCVDGKFVKVRGDEKKIPFIYGIDYDTHDIPIGLLALRENISAFSSFFSKLHSIDYPLKIIIGDDSGALKQVLKSSYPEVPFQLCQTHYLENIRQLLKIRTEDRYQEFFFSLAFIFQRNLNYTERLKILSRLREKHLDNQLLQAVIVNVYNRYDELFAYEKFKEYVPHSNNLIESYNSQLNPRLKSLQSFKSFKNAELWLNAWMIRRRTKPLTDCRKHFKKLNGKCSIELSMKSNQNLEKIYEKLLKF